MTAKEIQLTVCKQMVNNGHSPVCENLTYFNGEADVLSVSGSGYVNEFEVKISRADFQNDFYKTRGKYLKHDLFIKVQDYNGLDQLTANYFHFVCPEGLIKAGEVPPYAGLIYVSEHAKGNNIYNPTLTTIIKAPLIHKGKHDILKLMSKICRVQSERMYLGGCKLTVKNKEIQDRNKQRLIAAGFPEDYKPAKLKK